jgi:hypothetical protein
MLECAEVAPRASPCKQPVVGAVGPAIPIRGGVEVEHRRINLGPEPEPARRGAVAALVIARRRGPRCLRIPPYAAVGQWGGYVPPVEGVAHHDPQRAEAVRAQRLRLEGAPAPWHKDVRALKPAQARVRIIERAPPGGGGGRWILVVDQAGGLAAEEGIQRGGEDQAATG